MAEIPTKGISLSPVGDESLSSLGDDIESDATGSQAPCYDFDSAFAAILGGINIDGYVYVLEGKYKGQDMVKIGLSRDGGTASKWSRQDQIQMRIRSSAKYDFSEIVRRPNHILCPMQNRCR